MFLSFGGTWRSTCRGYSCWWSELVLLYVNRFLLFDMWRFELVEGQQGYKR